MVSAELNEASLEQIIVEISKLARPKITANPTKLVVPTTYDGKSLESLLHPTEPDYITEVDFGV
jgi:hypothetical protein